MFTRLQRKGETNSSSPQAVFLLILPSHTQAVKRIVHNSVVGRKLISLLFQGYYRVVGNHTKKIHGENQSVKN